MTWLMSSTRGLRLEMGPGMDWVRCKEKSVVYFRGRTFSVLKGVVGGKSVCVISGVWLAILLHKEVAGWRNTFRGPVFLVSDHYRVGVNIINGDFLDSEAGA